MAKDELKPIDLTKYKITETGQVTRMTEEDLRKQANSTIEWENTSVLDRPLFVHAYITGAKSRENRIEELEKENAELKEQCLILADCNTCHSTCKNENVEMKKQLTKAKELLTKWVELFKPKGGNIPPTPVQVETEQFIREVKEDEN